MINKQHLALFFEHSRPPKYTSYHWPGKLEVKSIFSFKWSEII